MADEKIRVVLEADASQLTREFSRAKERTEDLAKVSLPLVTRELDRSFLAGERMRRGLRDQAQATRGSRDGLLQLAQAADDAQYGMRGIMNNIPGLVMGFGGSSGLAGGISLAVLGLYAFDKGLRRFSGVAEIEKLEELWTSMAREGGAVTEGLQRQNRERREQEEIATRNAQSLREESERLDDLLATDRKRLEVQARADAALSRKRGLEDELARARGVDDPRAVLGRLREDEAVAVERLAAANAEYNRVLREGSQDTGRYASELAILKEELEGLRDANARTQGELTRAQGVVGGLGEGKGGKAGSIERENLRIVSERAERERVRLLQLEGEKARVEELLERARSAQASGLNGAQTEAVRQRELVEGLREELRVREQIVSAAATREVQRRSAEADAALALRKEQGLAERAAYEEEKREQRGRGREFLQDLRVLALRAGGRTAEADALGREVKLRRESVSLAKELGVTEERALELLRRRQGLEDAISRGPRAGSRIRRTSGIEVGERGLRSRLEVRGLRESRGLDRNAVAVQREREAGPDRSLERAARIYYERSLQYEEITAKALQGLGSY